LDEHRDPGRGKKVSVTMMCHSAGYGKTGEDATVSEVPFGLTESGVSPVTERGGGTGKGKHGEESNPWGSAETATPKIKAHLQLESLSRKIGCKISQ
jgi:hypothetical protein